MDLEKSMNTKPPVISAAAQGLIGQIEGLICHIKSQVLRGYIMRWLQLGRSTGDMGYLSSVLRHAQSAVDADELHKFRESNKTSGSGVVSPQLIEEIDHSGAMKTAEQLFIDIDNAVKGTANYKIKI